MKKFSGFIVLLICAANFCCARDKKANSAANNEDTLGYFTLPNGTMVDTKIPEDVADRMIKRIEAIENGDLAAFRSTLGEIQDGVDYHYQLGLIYKFFGDFFDIDSDAFNDAVATGELLTEIANTLFNSEHPLKSRNTGLFLRKMEITDTGGLMLIVMNNKNEKLIYSFTYY
jgi:hypothetical protein